MLAAEVLPGEAPRMLAAEREVTRLGFSVFRDGRISAEDMEAVLAVLRRMASIYRRLEVNAVRAVATAAVRDADDGRDFAAAVEQRCGVPVTIVDGAVVHERSVP